MLDPREGYQEIHHAPEFSEDELRKTMKNLLERFWPIINEAKPTEKIIKVPVNVNVVDNVRLALSYRINV